MYVLTYESNNCPCGWVGKKPLIEINSAVFELLMRQILIYFGYHITYICTSKDFHFYFFFLDGNYRVFLTRVKSRKIPYSLKAVWFLCPWWPLPCRRSLGIWICCLRILYLELCRIWWMCEGVMITIMKVFNMMWKRACW